MSSLTASVLSPSRGRHILPMFAMCYLAPGLAFHPSFRMFGRVPSLITVSDTVICHQPVTLPSSTCS